MVMKFRAVVELNGKTATGIPGSRSCLQPPVALDRFGGGREDGRGRGQTVMPARAHKAMIFRRSVR